MREILLELEHELEQNQELSSQERANLQGLASEINLKLENPINNLSSEQFVLSELVELAEDFEARHPRLTDIVGRLSDLLARMGL